MTLGYVLYIFFILPLVNNIIHPVSPVDADRLYYLLLTVLNTSIAFIMLVINKKYKNNTSKYIAYLSFFAALNHIYGRIVYQYDFSILIYHNIALSIVLLIITIMIWPMINGLFNRFLKIFNGNSYIRFGNNSNKKCDIKT